MEAELHQQVIPPSNRGGKKASSAFTLLELTLASVILLVAVLGLLAFYRSPFVLNEAARDTSMAVQDAGRVSEQIRTTPFGSIQTTPWDNWATTNGIKSLPEETILVAFTGGDPLEFTVTVQWTRRERQKSIRLTSRVAQGVILP